MIQYWTIRRTCTCYCPFCLVGVHFCGTSLCKN
jgi:hypothetical protein